MKICFVGAFPPSGRQLNEYAFHIAKELRKDPLLSLTILSDELDRPAEELPGFDVVRCWRFNDPNSPRRILKAVKAMDPDVVWFNLVFSSFGTPDHPISAFLGLTTPALLRMHGYYTHITLHHLMEHVDFSHAGINGVKERILRLGSNITTRILLMANSLSVLLPGYRTTLREKYRGEDVHFRNHGIFSQPEPPRFEKRNNPECRILAIGHWGTYKRLELMLEAFPKIVARVPDARLVVAGADHHTCRGYSQRLAEQYKDEPRIIWKGYVAEEDIPELYASSSIVVMPYSSSTGASGPAHQACEFGVPIVCSEITEFREMAKYESMAIDFYRNGDADDLAQKCIDILSNEQKQREMAEQNFSASIRMTMPEIIHSYLRNFDFHRRAKMLETLLHYRRLPRWVPSRSLLYRSASPGFLDWK
jgi:glycosyltransferase involved in cell wall biosynthesis